MHLSRFFQIWNDGSIQQIPSIDDAISFSEKDGYIWMFFSNPSLEVLTKLVEPLKLHPLSIEDCLDEVQIPKIDIFPDNTFILLNSYTYTERNLIIDEVNFFIGEKFLVSIIKSGTMVNTVFGKLEQMVLKNNDKIKEGPAFLLHILIDFFVDNKFEAIEALEDKLEETEDKILTKITDFSLADLQQIRKELLLLRKSLFHEREVLVKICRKDSMFINDKAIFHFRDIYDHLSKFFELTETFRDIVTSLMEMHLSMLNYQMTKAANKTNFIVRRLTFITTIFMPLTLLASIGGMSEWTMMTGPENWRISYVVFILAMIIIGVISFMLLKKIEKKDKTRDIISEIK